MRPSVRFEVFKRDAFTCAYCGRKPPEVTLEVDHVFPKAEGGTDEPENLTTSCFDCNRGKGATPLTREPSSLPDMTERVGLLREREEQLRAYHAALEELQALKDETFLPVWNYWFEVWRVDSMSRYHMPGKDSLRRYVDQLGPFEVKEAMEICAEKFQYESSNAVRYLYGILKRKLAEAEGRLTECRVCGQRLVIPPGGDTSITWRHGTCVDG